MNEENKDVKPGDAPTDPSTVKNNAPDGDGVKDPPKKPDETPEEKAKRLLDGTLNNKVIAIEKDRWDRIADKAKILESLPSAVIDRLLQDPKAVEQALNPKGGLEERLARIEEENNARTRSEIETAIKEAVKKWPDFETTWSEIRDDVQASFKRGVPYKEAVRRHYLAVHPEALQAEAEMIAKEKVKFSGDASFSPGSYTVRVKNDNLARTLTPAQAEVAKMYGHTEEQYAKLLDKWDWYLKAKGFYKPELEVPFSQKL